MLKSLCEGANWHTDEKGKDMSKLRRDKQAEIKKSKKIRKTPLDKKIEILGLACSMHCKVLLQNGVLFQDGGIEDQPYNI